MSRTAALLLALAAAIAAPTAVAHVQDAGEVVVLRGLDRVGPGAQDDAYGVRVIRGQGAAAQYNPDATAAVPPAPAHAPVAGKILWLVNGQGDEITACRLRKTLKVGERTIDCFAGALPR